MRKCKHKLILQKGKRNFYEGLCYCPKCDTYFTKNNKEI